jgi:hypothetical protein
MTRQDKNHALVAFVRMNSWSLANIDLQRSLSRAHPPIANSVYVERLRGTFFARGVRIHGTGQPGQQPGRVRNEELQECCSLVQDGVVGYHLEHVLLCFLREPGAAMM